jgi:hypothetical protein
MLELNLKKQSSSLCKQFFLGLFFVFFMMSLLKWSQLHAPEIIVDTTIDPAMHLPFFLSDLGAALADEPDIHVLEMIWNGTMLTLSAIVKDNLTAHFMNLVSQIADVQSVALIEQHHRQETEIQLAIHFSTQFEKHCTAEGDRHTRTVDIVDQHQHEQGSSLVLVGPYTDLIAVLCEKFQMPDMTIDQMRMREEGESTRIELEIRDERLRDATSGLLTITLMAVN